ncbi:MAG: chorismate--pyruvate lyase family protein [Endozoicomonas sp.]
MPFIDFSDLPWQPKQIQAHDIPQPWRHWLLDSGSLTRRLKAQCHEFSVEVLNHDWAMPTASEQAFLGCNNQRASIREVLLITDGIPRVFARSVLPESSLTSANHKLLELGNRPLGEFLFNHPSMQRGPIEIAELPARQFNQYPGITKYCHESAWGRRSLFYLNDKPISVCEVFLPMAETLQIEAESLVTN